MVIDSMRPLSGEEHLFSQHTPFLMELVELLAGY